ncbi:MAG: glycosyltransferase family 2 protein [Burkholderiaceae bacterium]
MPDPVQSPGAEVPVSNDAGTPGLSVIVIAKNEAHHIEACLRACAFADERIVLDSGSTDDTRELAAACGAQVHVSADWPGFGPQKNRALALSRGRWVLSIDADEVVSPQLRAAVQAAVGRGDEPGRPVAWWVRRASSFCGRVVRFGDWRNDRVIRLFRRDRARFSDDVVHERVVVDDGGAIGVLDGLLWHDSIESVEVGRQKMREYARLGAAKLRARGKKGGLASACGHASWTFVRGYLVRLGFLDGWRGLAIAWLNTQGTFLRYLWAAGGPPAETPAAERQP